MACACGFECFALHNACLHVGCGRYFDERGYKTHLGHFPACKARYLQGEQQQQQQQQQQQEAFSLGVDDEHHLIEWEGPAMDHPQAADSQPGSSCQPAAAAGDVRDIAFSQSAGDVLGLLSDTLRHDEAGGAGSLWAAAADAADGSSRPLPQPGTNVMLLRVLLEICPYLPQALQEKLIHTVTSPGFDGSASRFKTLPQLKTFLDKHGGQVRKRSYVP